MPSRRQPSGLGLVRHRPTGTKAGAFVLPQPLPARTRGANERHSAIDAVTEQRTVGPHKNVSCPSRDPRRPRFAPRVLLRSHGDAHNSNNQPTPTSLRLVRLYPPLIRPRVPSLEPTPLGLPSSFLLAEAPCVTSCPLPAWDTPRHPIGPVPSSLSDTGRLRHPPPCAFT
ncbi:hypothetical protein GW17_00040857 [Ensete ventricosum]|nr:hypothetical protein GW17_00040857 [Ensete ventricosum]